MYRGPAVLFVLLALTAAAAADPHPMSSGANPAPTTDAQVAMTAETLTIDIGLHKAAVKAVITLENQGAATKLVVGFPCAKGEDAGQIDVPCKVPLAVTVRGKKVKVAKKKSKAGTHWQWPLKLAANEKVELVVSYKAPLVNDRYGTPAFGMGLFTYRLTTGARWAGPIGKLDITVEHMHDGLIYVSPAGYTREPGRLTWSLTDHEPTEEVVIMPSPMAGNMLAGAIGGKSSAEAREKIAAGDYEKQDVEQAIKDMKDKGGMMEEWPAMISRLGGVPAPAPERVDAVVAESIKLLEAMAAKAKR
jgi:hypothetical protein